MIALDTTGWSQASNSGAEPSGQESPPPPSTPNPAAGSRVPALTALDSLSLGKEGQGRRKVRPHKRKRQKRKEKVSLSAAGFSDLLVHWFKNGHKAWLSVAVGQPRQGH